ncbi:class II aldolase/adducin family protein, partial [Candidatus Bathyarchaeota archaeon]
KALADIVQKKIADYDAVILENHGVVTVGSTIETASNLNEMVEEAAKIQLATMTLAGMDVLDLAKLKEKFKTENIVE